MNRKVIPDYNKLFSLNKKYINIAEAMRITGYSRDSIYRKIRAGVFTTKKIGRKKGQLIDLDSIKTYIYKII